MPPSHDRKHIETAIRVVSYSQVVCHSMRMTEKRSRGAARGHEAPIAPVACDEVIIHTIIFVLGGSRMLIADTAQGRWMVVGW